MTAKNSTPETTRHDWQWREGQPVSMYDNFYTCTKCKREIMYSMDAPESKPEFGCTGIKSPLKTPPNEKDAFTIMMMLSILANSRTDEEILYMLQPDKLKNALAIMHQAKAKNKHAFDQRPW